MTSNVTTNENRPIEATPTTRYTTQIVPYSGLNEATCRFFGIATRVKEDGEPYSVVYPYPSGGRKIRLIHEKKFFYEELRGHGLWGKDKFSPGSAQAITVTEGEKDAASVYQMLGSKYPAVSVRSAAQAREDCAVDHAYLNSFEKIYLCFDNDEVGQRAVREVAALFDVNKVYHVKMGMGFKDANDYLVGGKTSEFTRVWWNAARYKPKNILNSYEEFKAIIDRDDPGAIASYPFPDVEAATFGIRSGELILFKAQQKIGKALALDTPLPTPAGWTTIGDLKVGDTLFGRDGRPTVVTFITEDQYHDSYRVTFADGTSVVADGPHRWLIRDLTNNESIKTTQEMFDIGPIGHGSKARFMVPVADAVELPEADLPIDPYILGVWLADGSSASAYITLSDEKLARLSGFTVRQKYEYKDKCPSYMFEELTHKQLADLGVLKNKHIPAQYLRASIPQRTALFRGLCFDGWADKEFYNQNPRLLDGFEELARSLGYTCKRIRRGTTDHYTVRYKRKDYKAIRSIERVPTVPARCLTVDSPDHLFVCGDGWTLTHNTEIFRALEHHLLKTTDYSIGMIHLEDTEKRMLQGLLTYELEVPVHLPTCTVPRESQFDALLHLTKRDHRVNLYTHFGTDDPEAIVDAIRYMVGVQKCKFVFLDHLSNLAVKPDEVTSNERQVLDYLAVKFASLVKELDFTMFLISHVNDDGKTRGSRYIAKTADLVINLDRDKTHEDERIRNTTNLVIEDNRFSGITGPAGSLFYDRTKGTLGPVTPEMETDHASPF